MSAASSGQRFADYFVLAGLDTQVGLEPDRLSGKIFSHRNTDFSLVYPRQAHTALLVNLVSSS